jgi:hypothetical protein
LSEAELEDILSLDDTVLASIYAYQVLQPSLNIIAAKKIV